MNNQPKFQNKKFPFPLKKKPKIPYRIDTDKSAGAEVKKLDIIPNTIDYILVKNLNLYDVSRELLWKMDCLTPHLV